MAGKRKRADTEGDEVENSDWHQDQFQDFLADVLVILREHDTNPSLFDQPITSTSKHSHDSKRAKVSETSDSHTIASFINDKSYTTIEEVVKDVQTAAKGVAQTLQETLDGEGRKPAVQKSHPQLSRATDLQKQLDKLVAREMSQRPETFSSSIKQEPQEEEENTAIHNSRDNVLTLLADSRPPKQLFSSIQKSGGTNLHLGEITLPNGITTTRIIPKHSISTKDKPPPTFKDTFAPPPTLPSLPIPKQSRHTVTRSSSVNWYNPAEVEAKNKSSRRDNFTTQPLSSGQWLTYQIPPSITQSVSPESKRKQRDRALSFGEPQAAVSQESIAAHNQAKEDALFRSVYSSFAPDRDDSGALVASQRKNRLWWKRNGEARYQELLEQRNTWESRGDQVHVDNVAYQEEINEEDIQAAIENWELDKVSDEMKAPEPPRTHPPENTKEVEDMLQEISDLIETLNSHQRVRNMTLSSNSRTSVGQNPLLAPSPDVPSAAEFDIYETLKAQLTLIVSTLPPYLLAKLNGDQLEALNVSTKMQIEGKNQKGTMEEGEGATSARAAKAPASTATTQNSSAYPHTPARSGSYLSATAPSAPPNQAYARGGYGSSTASRAATNSSYLQNPQYSNRPASANYSSGNTRPPYPSQGGYPPRPAAAASANSYSYAPQFFQPPSQTSFSSYPNGYRPYTAQNTANYNYNQQYSTPQSRNPSNSASTPQAYRGSQTDYQQRAVPPQGYGYGTAQPGVTAASQNQQRSSSAQGQGGPQRPPLYQQHSSQYQSSTPASPLVNGTNGSGNGSPAPQNHVSTTDDQATFINRQKAQLAEQQSRQGSGTPQPPSATGQQNGSPAPQQNGIITSQA